MSTDSIGLDAVEACLERDIGIPGIVDTARVVLMLMEDQGTRGSRGTFVAWMRDEVPFLSLMQCARLYRALA